MTSHYEPYSEHYKIKKLVHVHKSPNDTINTNSDPHKRKTALIVVDVQNDFLPGGSLSVMAHKNDKGERECNMMINSINELLLSNLFDYYIFTQDAHPEDHVSFASTHDGKDPFDVIEIKNDFTNYSQVLWPDHCKIRYSDNDIDNDNHNGIALSDKLILPVRPICWKEISEKMLRDPMSNDNKIIPCKNIKTKCKILTDESPSNLRYNVDHLRSNYEDVQLMNSLLEKSYIIWKGCNKNVDSYSAFKDLHQNETGLRKFCTDRGIKDIYVCGLARDFCVWWSSVDATTYEYIDHDGLIKKEFNVYCILDATLPVPGSINLPDYDPNGHMPHQIMIKKLTPESVHGDLEKNNIEGNMWVNAFLNPYDIKAISWQNTINQLKHMLQNDNDDKQKYKSIFVKNNFPNIDPNINTNINSSIDFEFLKNII